MYLILQKMMLEKKVEQQYHYAVDYIVRSTLEESQETDFGIIILCVIIIFIILYVFSSYNILVIYLIHAIVNR